MKLFFSFRTFRPMRLYSRLKEPKFPDGEQASPTGDFTPVPRRSAAYIWVYGDYHAFHNKYGVLCSLIHQKYVSINIFW